MANLGLLLSLSTLLRPPLPRRGTVMRMHATVGNAGLFLLVNIVDAEPGERPRQPFSDKDGSEILT